jgi:hypothetical protein
LLTGAGLYMFILVTVAVFAQAFGLKHQPCTSRFVAAGMIRPFVAALVLGLLKQSFGFPSYRFHVPNGHRVPCPEGIEGCSKGDTSAGEPLSVCFGIGHDSCQGGTLPLNPFGVSFSNEEQSWSKALCHADSDGDGLTNGEELGDPCCLWKNGDTPSAYSVGN